jgi:alpha-tubulin suppressor-like RCC1 family protein
LIFPKRVSAVAAGDGHVLAVNVDGSLTAWGANSSGQLGDGTTTLRKAPVSWSLGSGERAERISTTGDHAVVITRSGKVFAWGGNRAGQVGDGSLADRPTAIELTQLSDGSVTSLGVGHHHAVAIVGHGPAVRLRLSVDPPNPAVGRSLRVKATQVDAFGTELRRANGATVTVDSTAIAGHRFTPDHLGQYLLQATDGVLAGSLKVTVR